MLTHKKCMNLQIPSRNSSTTSYRSHLILTRPWEASVTSTSQTCPSICRTREASCCSRSDQECWQTHLPTEQASLRLSSTPSSTLCPPPTRRRWPSFSDSGRSLRRMPGSSRSYWRKWRRNLNFRMMFLSRCLSISCKGVFWAMLLQYRKSFWWNWRSWVTWRILAWKMNTSGKAQWFSEPKPKWLSSQKCSKRDSRR